MNTKDVKFKLGEHQYRKREEDEREEKKKEEILELRIRKMRKERNRRREGMRRMEILIPRKIKNIRSQPVREERWGRKGKRSTRYKRTHGE